MTNSAWLKALFAQSHISMRLCDSYSPKWFAIKKGVALFNPKQIDKAHPTEFKMHVLANMYAALHTLK
jgi:hypothetical protein